jgi:hypothetical protein
LTGNAVTKASFTFQIRSATTVGVHGYTIRAIEGTNGPTIASSLYTLTVAANDDSASPLKSNLYKGPI